MSEGCTTDTVVLIGPPGSGKSTVGAELARMLGADFHDTDAAIEQSQGRTIAEIFVSDGEEGFRALERDAVAEALTNRCGVVALGGGAPLDPSTQELLERHVVVFLDVGIADAAKRVGFDASRPLLAINPRAAWTKLMNERRSTYEALATHQVETAGRSIEDVVVDVATHLGGRL